MANIVNFAHCTIATNGAKRSNLRTHFETGNGARIEGLVKEGQVTILHIKGKNLQEAVVIKGVARKTRFSPPGCKLSLM